MVAGNHVYNQIYSINSAQSSLKSYPLWEFLYRLVPGIKHKKVKDVVIERIIQP